MALSQSRLSTETPTFVDLIAEIKKGSIKIPQFQRKFIWKEPQAFKLLDSILNNYPIGSLLIWRTDVKLAAERNIGNFKLPRTDDMNPTDYVLDGQQRLTVIYASVGAPDNEEGFAPVYDLEKKIFAFPDDDAPAIAFPLRLLYNTTKVLNFRTGLQSHKNPEQLQSRLDEVIDAFTKYKLPVVTLKNLTVEEVCPIFERINSSGTKLSTYDLMVAATWSQEFDLNSKVEEIAQALKGKQFGKIDPDTVLKCLAAVKFKSVRQDQIIALRKLSKQEMSDLVSLTRESLLRSVDCLTTEFGIRSWELLPYEALLILLCYVYSRTKTPSEVNNTRLRQWFWRSSFSQRYRVGGENFVSKDLDAVAAYIFEGKGNQADFGEPPRADAWIRGPFRANNSVSIAFILALARRGPRNITDGALIDTEKALSEFNRKEFHHVSPRAFLKRTDSPGEHNANGNICLLTSAENKKISDDDPSKYLPGLVEALKKAGQDPDIIFGSNLLPPPSAFDYAKSNFAFFLHTRAGLIGEYVAMLCEGKL